MTEFGPELLIIPGTAPVPDREEVPAKPGVSLVGEGKVKAEVALRISFESHTTLPPFEVTKFSWSAEHRAPYVPVIKQKWKCVWERERERESVWERGRERERERVRERGRERERGEEERKRERGTEMKSDNEGEREMEKSRGRVKGGDTGKRK